MSRLRDKRVAIGLAIAAVAILTGCGRSSDPGIPVPGVGVIPGAGYSYPGGCAPLNGPIGFSGSNIYFDRVEVTGGAIPPIARHPQFSGQTVGQMTVSVGGAGGPFTGSGVDGTISMNVMPNGVPTGYYQPGANYYPGYVAPAYSPYSPPAPTTANVTGSITLNPTTANMIMTQMGGYTYGTGTGVYPYPGYPNTGYPNIGYPYNYGTAPTVQQVCVSGIAIWVIHRENIITSALAFIYINGTNHGYEVKVGSSGL